MKRTQKRRVSVSGQIDRRVHKTTESLREALHSLIVEKPYDTIVVKEILDRANVGRSTFYTHFRDKDELLASSIENIVLPARASAIPRTGKWYERILWFSLPIFEYHERHRASSRIAMPNSAKVALHTHLQEALTGVIGDAVASELPRSHLGRSKVPPELIVRTIASTFILVFDWWIEQATPLPAGKADTIFRSLVLPSLASL